MALRDILDPVDDGIPMAVKHRERLLQECREFSRLPRNTRISILLAEDRKRIYPLGIHGTQLNQELSYDPNLLTTIVRKLKDRGWDEFIEHTEGWRHGITSIDEKWVADRLLYYPFNFLLPFLTESEIMQYTKESLTYDQTKVDMEHDPIRNLYLKIINSAWRWTYKTVGWADVIRFRDFLRDFTFGDEGFAVHIDHTTGWNECGYSEYTRTYLDGVFGLIISYRGKQVATIGVSLAMVGDTDETAAASLLIHQIQLKEKRGNRWLYQLPKPLWQYALDRILKGAKKLGLPPYIVCAEALAAKIDANYAKRPQRMREEDNAEWDAAVQAWQDARSRVVTQYSQPIEGYDRGEALERMGMTFHKLTPSKRADQERT